MELKHALLIVLFLIFMYKQKEGYDDISVPSEVVLGDVQPASFYSPMPYFTPSEPYDPREIESARNSWGTSLTGLYDPQPNYYLPWTNPEGRKPSTIEELQLTERRLQHSEYNLNHDGIYPY